MNQNECFDTFPKNYSFVSVRVNSWHSTANYIFERLFMVKESDLICSYYRYEVSFTILSKILSVDVEWIIMVLPALYVKHLYCWLLAAVYCRLTWKHGSNWKFSVVHLVLYSLVINVAKICMLVLFMIDCIVENVRFLMQITKSSKALK